MLRRLSLLLVAGLAAVMLVAACDGDDDDGTSTAEPTTEATQEATTEATATEEATEEPTEEATEEPTEEPTEEATEEPSGASVALATTDLGDVLVGPDGLTLYLFTNDEAGVSNCVDSCADNWPALTVEAGSEPVAGDGVTGTLAVIERADGSMQVTINDVPLYYFAGDSAAGDTNGQGVGGIWFVVAADGTAIEG